MGIQGVVFVRDQNLTVGRKLFHDLLPLVKFWLRTKTTPCLEILQSENQGYFISKFAYIFELSAIEKISGIFFSKTDDENFEVWF